MTIVQYAAALLLLQIVFAVISIAANWPSQFGYVGRDAADEFVTKGTAVAPPLVPMLAFAAAIALASRSGPWGTAGVVALALLSILFIIGSLGELFGEPTQETPRWVLVASGVLGTVLYGALLGLALRALLGRR